MSTMCPDRSSVRIERRVTLVSQRGVSIVAAIFLLLLLAGLAALMSTLSMTQHATSAQDVQGSRAYQAARAGVEWGVYRALRDGVCASSASLPALADDLQQFTVEVKCTETSTTEAGVSVTVYRIVSVATSGALGRPNYVERQLEAIVG
ncbi:MAG TPA: hypothetical protein VFF81_13520 [Noviherbaspirillum sp.]|nr:hypothetical protein [Noviherbaspirillum sp.]